MQTEAGNNESALSKLRVYCKKIATPDQDLEELFKTYRLNAIDLKQDKCYMQVRRVQRWLYDIRTDNEVSGLIFIDLVLVTLQKQLRRDMTDAQDELMREVAHLYLRERAFYSTRPLSRGY